MKPRHEGKKKAMFSEIEETPTRTTVEHFLAGLAVWGVLMVIYAII